MKNKNFFILSLLSVFLSLLFFIFSIINLNNTMIKEAELGEAYNMINKDLAEIQTARTEINTLMYNLDVLYALSQEYGLDLKITTAIMRIESNFNPYAVSPNGKNFGLMQLGEVHVKNFESSMDKFDVEKNVEYASMLLSNLQKENNDMDYILNSYNMGKYGYQDYVQQTGITSRNYSRKVMDIVKELEGEEL